MRLEQQVRGTLLDLDDVGEIVTDPQVRVVMGAVFPLATEAVPSATIN